MVMGNLEATFSTERDFNKYGDIPDDVNIVVRPG
jgi:hypothetical protein